MKPDVSHQNPGHALILWRARAETLKHPALHIFIICPIRELKVQ